MLNSQMSQATTGQTLVSKQFLKDFAQLANFFEWGIAEIEEMKMCVREDKGMKEYLTDLAKAHRDGYTRNIDNNFQRLHEWKNLKNISCNS